MPPSLPRRQRRAALRDLYKGKAFTLLALTKIQVSRPITVRAKNGANAVTITVAPVGTPDEPAGPVGRFFSPAETLIVDRLRAATGPLTGPQIAKATGMPYEGHIFKALLRNLVDRDVVTHVDGVGYTLATADAN